MKPETEEGIRVFLWFAVFFAVVGVLMLFSFKLNLDHPENTNQGKCKSICAGQNMTYSHFSAGGYRNTVCYCKNEAGHQFTHLM